MERSNPEATVPRPLRLALVGAGRMGRNHAAAIGQSNSVDLVAVVDPSEKARAAVGEQSARRFEDVGQLLGGTAFDAAVVAAPTKYHLQIVTQLLEADVPILCEKPCGLTSAELHELADLAGKRHVPLRVGYWRRYAPALQALRNDISEGRLGEISLLVAVQWDEEPPHAAFRDPATNGGILVDMGVHEFDMLRWLTGQEITGMVGDVTQAGWAEPVPGDPEAVGLVATLSGGAGALISLARRHPPGDMCRVEVLGGDAMRSLTYLEPGDAGAFFDALRKQAEAMASLVAGKPVEGADVGDALAALTLAESARDALRGSGADVGGT